jgi:hypothetical protein
MTAHQQNRAEGKASVPVHRTRSIPTVLIRTAYKTGKWPLWASIALIIIVNTLIWGSLILVFV